MSDDPESDEVEKNAAVELTKMLQSAEGVMKQRIAERNASQEAEEAATASLTRSLNTNAALTALGQLLQLTEVFMIGAIVDWKCKLVQNRRACGPFVVVTVVSRADAHRISSADGGNFDPGSPLWGEVLDLEVAFIATDGTSRICWVDSRRMKKHIENAIHDESAKNA